MISAISPEPDRQGAVFYGGQDRPGLWLVQESETPTEGRFISREAAEGLARAERHPFPGTDAMAAAWPFTPGASFDSLRPDEAAFHCAA